jgi:type III pantothenate kinase
MLLTIDIGNSTATLGIFEGEKLISKLTIPSNLDQSEEEVFLTITSELRNEISAIIISSVVKELDNFYRNLSEKHFGIEPVFVDHTFDLGFLIKYFPPSGCGVDRLVAAFAATQKYKYPCIVCDFGTATTIDVVNSKNEYLGGIITPGMKTLADSLFEKTSKLPKVEILKPKSVIGDYTVGSIQSGIYFGYIGLVDGIIKRMFDELGEKPKVIATGGFSKLLSEESNFIEIVEPDLILDGLRLIYEKAETQV